MATIRTVTGYVLIGVGVIGTLVPIIPGTPLLLVGVGLVGPDHPWIRPVVGRLRRLAAMRRSTGLPGQSRD